MTEHTDHERIPQALRDRAAARTAGGIAPVRAKRKPAARSGRIVAAGASSAAGIGLVGVMAAGAGGQAGGPALAVQPPRRVVVIERSAAAPAIAGLPAASQADVVPTALVIDAQPTPAPAPVTVSHGS